MTNLSRSGNTNHGGKLTRRIDVPVSEELEEALIALAAIEGIPKSELGRRIWEEAVFGRMSMLRRMARPMGFRPSDEYPHPGSST